MTIAVAAQDRPNGVKRWLHSTDHKDIGTMYLAFAIIGGLVGDALSNTDHVCASGS
jgi:cytochrome c oxidase subunit 1